MQRNLLMTYSNSGKKRSCPEPDFIGSIQDNCVDTQSRIIYVHSDFEPDESGVDFRMAARFIKNLDYLNNLSSLPITLKMFSCGGCWNYGMSIYDAIASSKSPITCISYAYASSMSSIIPQAAANRYISKHCDFMIHYGTYEDSGDFRQVANGLKFSEKQNNVMLDLYADKCVNGPYFKERNMNKNKTRQFIKNKIEKLTDWWMTSEESVFYGFMDKVI